jgi:hypothetical protein
MAIKARPLARTSVRLTAAKRAAGEHPGLRERGQARGPGGPGPTPRPTRDSVHRTPHTAVGVTDVSRHHRFNTLRLRLAAPHAVER